MHRIRRRVLWIVAGVGVTTLALISWTALPALPVVGVAVAAIALVVNSMTSRLREPICLGCGGPTAGLPHGEHGVICPTCGHISSGMHLSEDPVGPTLTGPEDDEA
jgi:hypothetical protein